MQPTDSGTRQTKPVFEVVKEYLLIPKSSRQVQIQSVIIRRQNYLWKTEVLLSRSCQKNCDRKIMQMLKQNYMYIVDTATVILYDHKPTINSTMNKKAVKHYLRLTRNSSSLFFHKCSVKISFPCLSQGSECVQCLVNLWSQLFLKLEPIKQALSSQKPGPALLCSMPAYLSWNALSFVNSQLRLSHACMLASACLSVNPNTNEVRLTQFLKIL